MTNVLYFYNVRTTTKKAFEPFVLGLSDGTKCELLSTLRLEADSRKVVKENLDAWSKLDPQDESSDAIDKIIELISKIFYAVCDKPAKLLADLNDDDKLVQVALMSKVLNAWIEGTEAGEA